VKMLEGTHNITKIYSVLEMSWSKKTAHAKPRHFHALSIRLDGGADFTVGECVYSTKRNGILFMPKNCAYTLSSHRDEKIICIHFDTDSDIDLFPEVFTPVYPDILIEYFTELARVQKKKNSGYEYASYSLFYKILETVAAQKSLSAFGVSRRAQLCDMALRHINQNFTNPTLTVSEIARVCNVSEVYLRKIFKEECGVSPKEFIENRRLSYSIELLGSGLYTVEQVSEMCGIPNAKYFSRFFKMKKGFPPSSLKSEMN